MPRRSEGHGQPPGSFDAKLIFTVTAGCDDGHGNFGKAIIYQRYECGAAQRSAPQTAGRHVRRAARLPGRERGLEPEVCSSRGCRPASSWAPVRWCRHRGVHETRADHAVRQIRRQVGRPNARRVFLEQADMKSLRAETVRRTRLRDYHLSVMLARASLHRPGGRLGRAGREGAAHEAIDSAALAAARNLNSGTRRLKRSIFKATSRQAISARSRRPIRRRSGFASSSIPRSHGPRDGDHPARPFSSRTSTRSR